MTYGNRKDSIDLNMSRIRTQSMGGVDLKATKVLKLIDMAQPQCQSFMQNSQMMVDAIGQIRARTNVTEDEVRDILATCEMYGTQDVEFAESQASILGDIMMTQDFQDLSGQVIKKVIVSIRVTEKLLLGLLMKSAPERVAYVAPQAELAGPQVPDKALKQDDVDDLLASLGF
jgi:chemotaxis protein CheZ